MGQSLKSQGREIPINFSVCASAEVRLRGCRLQLASMPHELEGAHAQHHAIRDESTPIALNCRRRNALFVLECSIHS